MKSAGAPTVFLAVVAPLATLTQKLGSALPYHYREGREFRAHRRELLRDYAGRTTAWMALR